jgi:hypothetical protein
MQFVFITYLNRSGSTFLAHQLSKLDSVCVVPEAEILVHALLTKPYASINHNRKKYWKTINNIRRDIKLSQWQITTAWDNTDTPSKTYFDVFMNMLNSYKNTHQPHADCIVFKSSHLENLLDNPGLLSTYNIRFIAITRHRAGIYISQQNTISPATHQRFCRNPLLFFKTYVKYVQTIYRHRHQDNIHILPFQKLINCYDQTLSDLMQWLRIDQTEPPGFGLPGTVYQNLTPEYQKIHENVWKSPQFQVINNWRNHIDDTSFRALHCKPARPVNCNATLKLAFLRIHKTMLELKNLFSQSIKPVFDVVFRQA